MLLTLVISLALILSAYGSANNPCMQTAHFSPDIRAGSKVAGLNQDSDENPEELGDYYESDILIPSHKLCQTAVDEGSLLWPSGRVYYEISANFDKRSRAQTENAMSHISSQTCIVFTARSPDQPDYVKFTADNTGCWTETVGRLGGEQKVNLQIPSCVRKMGSVIHQLVHVLGIGHEHNRPDRDQHIDILWHNVNETHANKFNNAQSHTDTLDLPYDPYSIMHYSPNVFAKDNQLNTIQPKRPDVNIHKIGQREGLSKLDALKVNILYESQCSPNLE